MTNDNRSVEAKKRLLEKLLTNLTHDVSNSNLNEAELFKKFQIASRSNPQLTYAEFIKSLKE